MYVFFIGFLGVNWLFIRNKMTSLVQEIILSQVPSSNLLPLYVISCYGAGGGHEKDFHYSVTYLVGKMRGFSSVVHPVLDDKRKVLNHVIPLIISFNNFNSIQRFYFIYTYINIIRVVTSPKLILNL